MGWSCVIISTVCQKQHTQEFLSNVLPFINTLSFGSNVCTSKRQRLVNVFVSNPVIPSTFSNIGYGTASFFITATWPLQKHFQSRLWRCKFFHHDDRTIVKTPNMTTFMLRTYGTASLLTTWGRSWHFGNSARTGHMAAYKAWEPV
jgi:hypothetical protein